MLQYLMRDASIEDLNDEPGSSQNEGLDGYERVGICRPGPSPSRPMPDPSPNFSRVHRRGGNEDEFSAVLFDTDRWPPIRVAVMG